MSLFVTVLFFIQKSLLVIFLSLHASLILVADRFVHRFSSMHLSLHQLVSIYLSLHPLPSNYLVFYLLDGFCLSSGISFIHLPVLRAFFN